MRIFFFAIHLVVKFEEIINGTVMTRVCKKFSFLCNNGKCGRFKKPLKGESISLGKIEFHLLLKKLIFGNVLHLKLTS